MGTEPRRLKRPDLSTDRLFVMASTYLSFRGGREGLAKQEETIKKDLMGVLEVEGEEGENGHRFYWFPQPLELSGKPIYGFKREKRAGAQDLDEEAAMALIEAKGLTETCIEMIPVINEDALLAANFEEKISDDELAALYTEKDPTYAFVLMKEEP